jgi:hypothetical protein
VGASCPHPDDIAAVLAPIMRRMSLSRISWWVTVGACVVAAILLIVNGYSGYSGVLLAVGAAAAVNLF